MRRTTIGIAMIAALSLAACGDEMGEEQKAEELRPLDPNPPMSASDIDMIVNATRESDASRGGGAMAPAAENASTTN